MAEEVGQAYVSVDPSLKGWSAKLKAQLAEEMKSATAPIEEAGSTAGKSFGDKLHAGIKSKLGAIGDMLKTGLIVGATAAVAGLGALTAFGLKSAGALEQTNIGIQALVGNVQDAQKFVADLQKFAAATPFEFAGVADASRRILAFGQAVGITRDQVIPTLTTIGNLVSVLGGSQENIDAVIRAMGQISSTGHLMGGDLLQIAQALPGFDVHAAIAAKLGVSVAEAMKMQAAGTIDAKTAIDGLLEGMANFKGAAGAMEKQSQTLNGVLSTFKDTVGIALTNAFQPVIPQIKDTLTQITPVIGDALTQLGPSIGGVLGAALPLIGQLVQAVVPILTPLLGVVSGVLKSLGDSGVLASLGDAFGKLLTPLVPLGPVIGQLASKLVGALVPVIVKLADSGIIDTVVNALIDLLPSIIELVPPLVDLAVAFAPLTDLMIALSVPLLKLTVLWVDFLASKAIVPLIESLAAAVTLVLTPIEDLVPLVGQFVDWLKGIDWSGVGKAIGGAFADAWKATKDFFADIGTWLVDKGKDLVSGLWEGIKSMGSWLKDKVTGFFHDNTIGAVQGLLQIHSPSKVFEGIGEDTIAGYAQGVQGMANHASAAMTTTLGPAAATSGVGQPVAPAAPPVVALQAGDSLMAAFFNAAREHVRGIYGNDVTLALQV